MFFLISMQFIQISMVKDSIQKYINVGLILIWISNGTETWYIYQIIIVCFIICSQRTIIMFIMTTIFLASITIVPKIHVNHFPDSSLNDPSHLQTHDLRSFNLTLPAQQGATVTVSPDRWVISSCWATTSTRSWLDQRTVYSAQLLLVDLLVLQILRIWYLLMLLLLRVSLSFFFFDQPYLILKLVFLLVYTIKIYNNIFIHNLILSISNRRFWWCTTNKTFGNSS